MKGKVCISCKKEIVNDQGSAHFNCPKCGDYEVVRCNNCRTNATKYRCPSCEFEGPN